MSGKNNKIEGDCVKGKRLCKDLVVIVLIVYGICGGEILNQRQKSGMKMDKIYQQEENSFLVNYEKLIQVSSDIRVLISTTGYVSKYHQVVTLGSEQGMIVEEDGGEVKNYGKERISISLDEIKGKKIKVYSAQEDGRITVYSVLRNEKNPSYYGKMELNYSEEGIIMINEVDLEKYLYSVIPSEMPLNYEIEALKAQAVCARTYAVSKMQNGIDETYLCHLDDSVSSQVYGNKELQEESIKVVNETKGIILVNRKNVGTAYYFSTSCGSLSEPEDIWIKEREELVETSVLMKNENQELENKIKKILDDEKGLEQNYPYFRWTVKIPYDVLENKVKIGEIKNIRVSQRGESGVAKVLTIEGEHGVKHYVGEYEIRSVLTPLDLELVKHNKEITKTMNLLPSGYFYGIMEEDGYMIYGGGYGHGAGMSQNGANELAKQGYTFLEILKYYYSNVEIL